MSVTPIDLSASSVRLHHDGRVRTEDRTAAPGGDGWKLTVQHAKTDADLHAGGWEAHPEAEEIVACLIGKIRLHLSPEGPGGRAEEIRLTAGTAAVVPRGRWHRVELDVPSSVLTVTVPRAAR